jgi:hypothetical protein
MTARLHEEHLCFHLIYNLYLSKYNYLIFYIIHSHGPLVSIGGDAIVIDDKPAWRHRALKNAVVRNIGLCG